MRKMLFCLSLALSIALLVNRTNSADVAAASVNSHMQKVNWLSGSFACTSRQTFTRHKPKTVPFTLNGSELEGGWIELSSPGYPGGVYYGFDPKKNKYIAITISGPGAYAAAYATLKDKRTLMVEFPSIVDSDPETPHDAATLTKSAAGFVAHFSGASRDYPGERYDSVQTCARK
jgi:hypothetical protein